MGYGYLIALDYQSNVVACAQINGNNYKIIEFIFHSWYHHEVLKVDEPIKIGSHWEKV